MATIQPLKKWERLPAACTERSRTTQCSIIRFEFSVRTSLGRQPQAVKAKLPRRVAGTGRVVGSLGSPPARASPTRFQTVRFSVHGLAAAVQPSLALSEYPLGSSFLFQIVSFSVVLSWPIAFLPQWIEEWR
jgi:hypothetical protein